MIIIFILIVSFILIGSHYGLYVSWVWLFGLKSLVIKKALLIILGILSVSFIITAILIHWFENPVTSNLYILAATWLCTAWYIILATVLALVLVWISSLVGFDFNKAIVTSVLIGLAVIFTGYGVWNAQQIKIKNISVSIKNLPASWQGKKAVHISDVHLGAVHRYGFMGKIISKINSVSPDIIFITGDFFDGGGQKLNHLASPLNELDPDLGIYFATGNHETYISLEKSLAALSETKAKVLRDELIEVEGVQILGVDYSLPGKQSNIDQILSQIDSGKPSIVLYHEPKAGILEKVKNAGADLFLSGHTHRGQLWPFRFVTKMMYKGLDYGLHQDGEFSLYTSSGVVTWGPPMRTTGQPEIVVINFK